MVNLLFQTQFNKELATVYLIFFVDKNKVIVIVDLV